MKNAADVWDEVKLWVAKADTDFRLAESALVRNDAWEADDICFHAQQAAEKYIKARLVLDGIRFPRTHDIRVLFQLLPARMRPKVTINDRNMLTVYATTMRYPGDYDPTTIHEAKATVRIVRKIRRKIRESLPADCLSENS